MKIKKLFLPMLLKMFDNTNVTGDAGMSVEMKTFYSDHLIDLAEPKLVHDQFAAKYDIPANGGKSIEFRQRGAFAKALTPLQEGVTPSGKKLAWTNKIATIAQYGDYVEVSDVLKLTAIDNNIVEATKGMGSAAGKTLDTVTRDIIQAGTNVLYAPAVAEDGTKTEVLSRKTLAATSLLTPELIWLAATKLEAVDAEKFEGGFVAIIHPHAKFDVMRNKEFIEVIKYKQPDQYFEGEIGKIGDVTFVISSESKIWKDASTPTDLAVYGTLVIAQDAYATTKVTGGGLEHIVKPLGSAGSADPLNQRATVGWKAIKTAVRLVEEYMVRIEHTTSFSKTAVAN